MKARKVAKRPVSAATEHGPKGTALCKTKRTTGAKTTQASSVLQRRAKSARAVANPILRAAQDYLRRGLSVVPIQCGTKRCSLRKWKHYQNSPPSPAKVEEWFSEHPDWQLAIILGDVSGGVVVRDFDDKAVFDRWVAEHPEWAASLPTVATARGLHVYLRSADTRSRKVVGGELRGDGNYVLAPPSKHPDGATYKWLIPLPDDGDIPEADLVAIGLLPPPPEKNAVEKPVDNLITDGMPGGLSYRTQRFLVHGVDEGCRNTELFVAACNLAAAGVSRKQAEVMLRRGCRRCYPPLEGDEVRRTIDSAYSKVRKLPNSSGVFFDMYVIPRAIVTHPDLSDSAKLVWGALDYRQRANIDCFPSIATIAKDIGRAEDTARKAVQRLEEAGLLRIRRFDGYVNHYETFLLGKDGDKADSVSRRSHP
jgi:hypothetical protein